MGLLSGLFNRRARDATSGSVYRFLMGPSAAGKQVNETTAMQMTAVYAAVRILSETIASLPLNLYRYTPEGGRVKAVDHPLYFIAHNEANSEMSSFIFRETAMSHLLLWGNSYSQIIRNGRGEVLGLYPLMPDRMKVDRDERGRLYYEYQLMQDDAKTFKGKDMTVRLNPEDVLHIPGLGFDGLVGYSPIGMARNTIGLSLATEEYASKLFANGATPSGVLSHPNTLEHPENLRDSWQRAFGGSNNAGRVAVLEEGVTYTPITMKPEEAQFLETRKFMVTEIARFFRIPPHMLADLDRATFSNIENQSIEFVKYTLEPWVSRIESAMNRRLLLENEKREYYFKFNVDGLLRGDFKSRMEGYSIGIQNGFLCPNDVRSLEELDLIPEELGGNRFLVNGSMTPLENAGAAYSGPAQTTEVEKGEEDGS